MAIAASSAQSALAVAAEHQEHLGMVRAAQTAAIITAFRGLDLDNPIASWIRGVGARVFALLSIGQEFAAGETAAYVPRVLAAQNIVAAMPVITPSRFAGIASDNRDLDSLLAGAPLRVSARLRQGLPATQARQSGEAWLRMVAQTQMQDAARAADSVAIAAAREARITRLREALATTALSPQREAAIARRLAGRMDPVARAVAQIAAQEPPPVDRGNGRGVSIGYVRMLNPPSCSRCAVLAGRWYRWNAGFQRHPSCDCIAIPAAEAAADDLTTNPHIYFDSLSRGEQDEYFGKANAAAIRDGADINQVVNAGRKGAVFTADDGKRYTREGTTRRGFYGGTRGKDSSPVLRPTVWQIYRDAKGNRDAAMQALRLYRYVV